MHIIISCIPRSIHNYPQYFVLEPLYYYPYVAFNDTVRELDTVGPHWQKDPSTRLYFLVRYVSIFQITNTFS